MSHQYTAGEDLEPGDPVYLGQDGKFYKVTPEFSGDARLRALCELKKTFARLEALGWRVRVILRPVGFSVRCERFHHHFEYTVADSDLTQIVAVL